MAELKKTTAKFHQVRSIYGHGKDRSEALDRYGFIPKGGMNRLLENWHAKQPQRELSVATPSQITRCPRSIWLELHGVPRIDEMTWALKQRLLLGRLFENQFAEVLTDQGMLLHHWKDDPGVVVDRFEYGKPGDETYFNGVPDYLTNITLESTGEIVVAISDAKTSRSDSFGYLPTNEFELFTDGGWYKNRMQLVGYYILCHANKAWFDANSLPLPTHCHLFSYALDDGVVRREVTWKPTVKDRDDFLRYVKRFNMAIKATDCPDCTCGETFDGFEVKFCPYGIKDGKICTSCCSDDLIPTK